MKKVVRGYTQDAMPRWRPLTRDEVLEAQTPRKSVALGAVWDGSLKPKMDTLVEEGGKLHGFMLGHVVGAEPSPVIDQLLGRVWRGIYDMRSALLHHDEQVPTDVSGLEQVDTTEALAAVEQLRQALGTEKIDMGCVGDAVGRLKRARDSVRRGATASRATGDRRPHPMIGRQRMTGDGSKPVSIAELNQRNRDHWDVRTGATTAAARAEVRDAQHAVAQATDQRSLNAGLNQLNRAFWEDRRPKTRDSGVAVGGAGVAKSLSIADINARNRQYWAKRG